MKIDWEKAKQIAAKRFEDVITACNKGDADDLKCYMESGMALPEDYILDDEPEPDECYKYLDVNDCFITDNGYICKMVQSTAPDGYEYYLPYIASKQDGKIVWTIVPYKVKSVPGNGKGTAILYTDELVDAIHTVINNIIVYSGTVSVCPAVYDEVIENAVV